MFKIAEKKELAPSIWYMNVDAPRVARTAKPGQFVIVRTGENGERVPLTIADYNPEQGSVAIVIQAIGVSTKKICALDEGESLTDFVGPLGRPSDFVSEDLAELRHKKILFVAGGVGTAPVYPQVKWLHDRGIAADVIVGAKSAEMHIMTEMMRNVAGNLYLATDDGSLGYHGQVTGLLRQLVEQEGKHYDEVVAIGPMVMMKFVALLTKELGIKTVVSLNTLMVDGTGMCGACRVSVGGKTYFTCVDGPEFDGHQVDFDEAIRRQGMYRSIEERAAQIAADRAAGHKCHIGLDRK
jgi:ferredoxin--NADP+ reductase